MLLSWLLRHLPSYRHLLTVHDEKLRLEERLTQERAEKEWLREQLDKALREKDDAYKIMHNVGFQKAYGVKPHPEVVGIPEEFMKPETPGPIAPKFYTGQDMVRLGNDKFYAELKRRTQLPVTTEQ